MMPAPPLDFLAIGTATPLPSATVGVAYSVTLSVIPGIPPYSWSITSALPDTGNWLSIGPVSGILSGTPGTAEIESIIVMVSDALAVTASKAFSLTVNSGASLSISTSNPLPAATVGYPYSATLSAINGVPPYGWAITSDSPDTGGWLSINPATGALSGTPGTAETETVLIKVTDSASNTASKSFSLTVGVASGQAISIAGNRFVNSSGATQNLFGMDMTGLEFIGVQNQLPINTWAGTIPKWSQYVSPNWPGLGICRIPLCSASWLGLLCYTGLSNTTLTFTAILGSANSSGTITAPWGGASGNYPLMWDDGSGGDNNGPYTNATLTNGSTAVTFNIPLTSTAANTTAYAANWNGSTRNADPQGNYQQTVIDAVANAQALGWIVVLDLHWSSPKITIGGVTGYLMPSGQNAFAYEDPDGAFWQSIATTFGTQATPPTSSYGTINNGAIVFELFNEPYFDSLGVTIYSAANHGGSSVTPDAALKAGGWVDRFINQIGGAPQDYKIPVNIQHIGYQSMLNLIRAIGANNCIVTNGNSYAQNTKNYLIWMPADTLGVPQVAIGWHPYPNGNNGNNYPYTLDGPYPLVGTDSGTSTAQPTDYQYANSVLAAGVPMMITECGSNAFGSSATATPPGPQLMLLLQWAWANNVPLIGWEGNDVRAYGSGGNFSGGGAPFFAAYASNGTTVLPVLGNGSTLVKWSGFDHTPMKCISRSGIYGQVSSGSATTMTDLLQDWVPGSLVGALFYDCHTNNTNGATITANTGNTISFSSSYGATPAITDAYYIQTAQMIPTLTGAGASGAYSAGWITVGACGNYFESGGTLPLGVVFNISTNVSHGMSSLLLWISGHASYGFDPTTDGLSASYNQFGSYTIDVSANSGSGAAPGDTDPSWVTLVARTNNFYQTRSERVTVSGYNWVRFHCTGYAPSNTNAGLIFHMDLYDVSHGLQNVFGVGDSWMANAFNWKTHGSNGDPLGNYAAGQLVPNANALLAGQGGSPGYRNGFPYSFTNGGQAGWASAQMDANLATFLATFAGSIGYLMGGLNDLPTAPATTNYATHMPSMISTLQAAGLAVMVSPMPFVTDLQHQGSGGSGFNTYWPLENTMLTNAIAAGCVEGPNLRQLFFGFVGGPPVGSTGVTAVSSAGGSVTISDTSPSYGSIWWTNVFSTMGAILNDLTTGTVVGPITSNTTTTITASGSATVSINDIYNVTALNYTIGSGSAAGSATSLQDLSANWPINGYKGSWVCDVTQRVYALITSNTSNTLTFSAGWSGPGGAGARSAAGDTYSLNGQTMVMQAPYGDGLAQSGAPQALHCGGTGQVAWTIWLDWAIAAMEQSL